MGPAVLHGVHERCRASAAAVASLLPLMQRPPAHLQVHWLRGAYLRLPEQRVGQAQLQPPQGRQRGVLGEVGPAGITTIEPWSLLLSDHRSCTEQPLALPS